MMNFQSLTWYSSGGAGGATDGLGLLRLLPEPCDQATDQSERLSPREIPVTTNARVFIRISVTPGKKMKQLQMTIPPQTHLQWPKRIPVPCLKRLSAFCVQPHNAPHAARPSAISP